MNQQQRPQRPVPRPQSHGRMKEQRPQDYAATPDAAMDKLAHAMARTVIRECSLPDETNTWRRLSGRFREVAAAAYNLGFEDGERVSAQRR